MDQLPRLGKRELICLLLFTCNYVVSLWRGFLFLWVLGMGYVILLWHSLSLHIIISLVTNDMNCMGHLYFRYWSNGDAEGTFLTYSCSVNNFLYSVAHTQSNFITQSIF